MLEGKKISELETTTQLQNACCFPVLNNGVTRRITFGSLLSQIENNLPETGIDQVKEDVETLKTRADETSGKINTLNDDVENIKTEVADVDEMVAGQNATIRNCVSTVEGLEQIIEQTHFDDVLELEEQVRANTSNVEQNTNDIQQNTNNIEQNTEAIQQNTSDIQQNINDIQQNAEAIENKQDKLNATQLSAVNSGITAELVTIIGSVPQPATQKPKVAGTAAVGTSEKYAKEDHVHPTQTSVTGSSGSCTGNSASATALHPTTITQASSGTQTVDGVTYTKGSTSGSGGQTFWVKPNAKVLGIAVATSNLSNQIMVVPANTQVTITSNGFIHLGKL